MRLLPSQAGHVMETAIDRFDNLANTGQPAAPSARPGPLTGVLGSTDHLGTIGVPPMVVPRRVFKAFVGDVGTLDWRIHTG